MSDDLIRDNPVSNEQIRAWADEAERGYDLTKLAPPIPGRPLVGSSSGVDATRPGILPRLRDEGPRTISRARPFAC